MERGKVDGEIEVEMKKRDKEKSDEESAAKTLESQDIDIVFNPPSLNLSNASKFDPVKPREHDSGRFSTASGALSSRQDLIFNMDEALDEVGGFGRHQMRIWIIEGLCIIMGSYSLYPIGFYELQPVYLCQYQN